MIRTGMFLFSILNVFPALAQTDFPGSADHPMFSRYPGSYITHYEQRDYDAYELLLGATREFDRIKKVKRKNLEGRLTRIVYQSDQETSAIKVYRNYENAIKKAGFRPLFQCRQEACGLSPLWENHLPVSIDYYGVRKEQYYYAGVLQRGGKQLYVALYVRQKQYPDQVNVALDVVESRAMESNLVKVDPKYLGDKLQQEGKVALYGIYFDTDKADIKPKSAATLKAIAQLLKQKPGLKLYVVGHTDDTGTLEHNRNLSSKRARAVVEELMLKYGVEQGRLSHFGAGPYAPVASNLDEAGRAKNRRVELVQRLQ